jgi:two-component system sensor histidine kinase RegB
VLLKSNGSFLHDLDKWTFLLRHRILVVMGPIHKSTIQMKQDLSWYLSLRWVTAIVVVLSGVVCYLTILPASYAAVFLALGAGVALNNARLARLCGSSLVTRELISTVALDILVLTVALALTGGASNPFSFFYVVHVGIAALLLGERWTWGVAALASLCFGALFFVHREVPQLSHHHQSAQDSFSLHLQGMWVAFTLVAAVLAFFFTRLVRSVRAKDKELLELTQKNIRAERYAVSATLAASAAHEMNTPLGAIRLLAESLEEELSDEPEAQRVKLILGELARCQKIIRKLRTDTGGGVGELPHEVLASEIVADAMENLSVAQSRRIQIAQSCEDTTLYGPRDGLVVSVRALLKNALEASSGEVIVNVCRDIDWQFIQVINPDTVVSPEILVRIGEPFFTTKEAGRSLGLGVYLARGMAESLGGSLVYRSDKANGTVAEFKFLTGYLGSKVVQNG